ncbi:MAG: DUF4271 domain-containing protein [Saprospiraceae bacterium]|nr:DUF4271 domain-containing protein [Saprospiraceae bacterium]
MIRYFLLFFVPVFFFPSDSEAQSERKKNNPFEIVPRLDSVIRSESQFPSSGNTSTDQVLAGTEVPDTSTLNIDLLNNNSTGINEEDKRSPVADQKKNPFEVDHVPIRKSSNVVKNPSESFGNVMIQSTGKTNNFLIWFLLISAALLAIVMSTRHNIIGLIYKSIFNENMLKLFQREENTRFSSYLVLLYLIFIINITTFIYLLINEFGPHKGIQFWLYLLVIITLIYISRHTALSLLGWIFNISKNTGLYSFTIMLFNLFIGLILIPLNLILSFGPDILSQSILYISLFLLAFLLIIRTFRGVFIASDFFNNRLFQIIIYLCAFEIAPMLILVKTAVKFVI